MKILLISPAIDGKQRTNKGLMIPQLALFILEGLTPSDHEVKIIEEEAEEIDLDEDCDLVGISCMTANAPRAYYFAGEFKKRGKTVIMGGVHPTILPDEALKYSDSVVIGEAEGVWQTLLDDFQSGNLQETYHDAMPDLSKYVPKNFNTVIKRRLFNLLPLMTTRGCPYNCDFCCVTNLFGKKIRHVPVENVVRDIKESGAKNYMFLDDNIIGHPKYAKELFRAITPLKIHWVGQASISLVKDTELMQLATKSGCKGFFIGLESVSEVQLKTMRKSIKDLKELESALKKIRKMGIIIQASMIFGFDNDTKEVFDDTVKFLIKNKISTASLNVLTPYPGTKTYNDLRDEGRLLTTDWKYYDHNTVVFKPRNMTPYELQLGKNNARRKFFKLSSIFRRFPGSINNPFFYFAINRGGKLQVKIEAKRLAELREVIFKNNGEQKITAQAGNMN